MVRYLDLLYFSLLEVTSAEQLNMYRLGWMGLLTSRYYDVYDYYSEA